MGDLADRVTTKNKGMVSELPLTISAQDGLISQDEFFNKKVASKDLSSYLLLHHGDFAYNKSYSNGYPFGTIKRLEKYPQGVVSSLYIAFKPNSSISSDFMAQYYESNNWHKEIYKCAAEGARNHGLLNVPPSDFFATNLNIPITKSEQLKIGRLLNAVDQTITLHEEKKHQLERLKSALLQKMFADKSGYPDIRFEGFSDEWEQCKAKELFESKSKKDHSDLPVLSATQENGIVFRNDLDIDIKFDTHALSNYKVVSPGDYIISLRSFQGGFELSEKLGIISPAYTVFAFNNQEEKRHNNTFWKYLFKRYDFIESLKRLTFGIRDGKAISFTQFSTLKLSFPNFDEQNKIATLLHELDRTITLHDQKLNLLKLVKQSLLQNMFI
ncbi:restriction endonuclease subunit S [Lactobacillus delbrueckii subsp. bulgaricus]